MHEMSICANIIEILEEQAQLQNFHRITKLNLAIGRLSGVEIDSLEFCFQTIAQGTVADGADVSISCISGLAWCVTCQKELPLADRFESCPHCGTFGLKLLAGDELKIENVEAI